MCIYIYTYQVQNTCRIHLKTSQNHGLRLRPKVSTIDLLQSLHGFLPTLPQLLGQRLMSCLNKQTFITCVYIYILCVILYGQIFLKKKKTTTTCVALYLFLHIWTMFYMCSVDNIVFIHIYIYQIIAIYIHICAIHPI